MVFSVIADRRGFDGPIQLTVADLPKGIHVEGGIIPREYMDASNARTFNRRGVLTLTADPDVDTAHRPTASLGRGQAGRRHGAPPPRARHWDGDGRRRRHRAGRGGPPAPGDRPVARTWTCRSRWPTPPPATLEVRQTSLKQMEEGARYEYAYKWTMRGRGTPPAQVGVDVIGAKDIRVIDMKAETGRDVGHLCRDHDQGHRPGALRPVHQRTGEDGRWRRSDRVARRFRLKSAEGPPVSHRINDSA